MDASVTHHERLRRDEDRMGVYKPGREPAQRFYSAVDGKPPEYYSREHNACGFSIFNNGVIPGLNAHCTRGGYLIIGGTMLHCDDHLCAYHSVGDHCAAVEVYQTHAGYHVCLTRRPRPVKPVPMIERTDIVHEKAGNCRREGGRWKEWRGRIWK